MRKYFGADVKKTFSAEVKEIIKKSGDIGVEYAEKIEECLACGDEGTAEKYGSDLARFLKHAKQDFMITSVEYDSAMEELELLVVIADEFER